MKRVGLGVATETENKKAIQNEIKDLPQNEGAPNDPPADEGDANG